MQAFRASIALVAVALLATGTASARPTPGASWLDGEHEGDVSDPCCGHFRAHANASDVDDSGLYDSVLGNATANATSPKGSLFPSLRPPGTPPAPRSPVSYDVALAANARAWDSTERDLFDNGTARARAAVNLTLRDPVYQPIVNGSARFGVHCENRDRTLGPESCSGAAARAADPLASWRAALAAKRAPGGAPFRGMHGGFAGGGYGALEGSTALDRAALATWLARSVAAER